MSRFEAALVLAVSLCAAFPAMAGTHLDVRDDRDVYEILDRLEAEGAIESGLLSTKPIGRKEVLRLLRQAESGMADRSAAVRDSVGRLRKMFGKDTGESVYVKPVDRVSAGYIGLDSGFQPLNYNNDGDMYRKGSNLRLAARTRGELSWLAWSVTPEVRISEEDETVTARKAYAVLTALGIELTAGRESLWWGPGRHGALLLTNNAEPIPVIRLSTSQAVLLPWIFRRLGPFRFDAFAGRLESDRRDIASPIFWGLRFDFKPHPAIEVGLERTVFMGGKGRPEGLSTWWDSFTGKGENDPGGGPGDQKAGFDLKLTLPWRVQPAQLYLEAAGEDSAGGWPSRWAYLLGFHLPRVGALDWLGVRGEYASTHYLRFGAERVPDYWYRHSVYTQGYTYKGRVIGHHMDTDSSDFFLELSFSPPGAPIALRAHLDREEHNLSRSVRERKDEAGLDASFSWGERWKAGLAYGFGRVRNPGNAPGPREDVHQIAGRFEYNL